MEQEDLAAGYEAEYEVLDGPVVRGREHHGVLGGPGGRGDRGRGDHQDCESNRQPCEHCGVATMNPVPITRSVRSFLDVVIGHGLI